MPPRKQTLLKKMTVPDLKKILKDNKFQGYSKMKKVQLIAKILELKIDFSEYKSSKVKRVISDERKEELRERLKNARAKRHTHKVSELKEEPGTETETETEETNQETKMKNKELKIKIRKQTAEEKEEKDNMNFDDVIEQMKLPKQFKNIDNLIKEVIVNLDVDIVKKIFQSKKEVKSVLKIIRQNKDRSNEEIVSTITHYIEGKA